MKPMKPMKKCEEPAEMKGKGGKPPWSEIPKSKKKGKKKANR